MTKTTMTVTLAVMITMRLRINKTRTNLREQNIERVNERWEEKTKHDC